MAKIKKTATTPNIKKAQNSELLEMKNQLARALADYDNLNKRTAEEKNLWFKFSAQKIVEKLIPVLDLFESAQKHLNDQGLYLAINEFKNILKEEGLEEISPKVGDQFDENLFEVIEIVKGNEDEKVAEMIASGWKFTNGNVVRHAKVKVSKKGIDN